MRLWYDNEIYKCDLTASSEETGYPGPNLQDTQLAKTYPVDKCFGGTDVGLRRRDGADGGRR